MSDDVPGPDRAMLDAFDLIRLTSSGAGELFAAARAKAADYDEPGDLAAGVASVGAMLLRLLGSVTDQSAEAILDQLHDAVGDTLLQRNAPDA